jgi:phosphate uptake regulator
MATKKRDKTWKNQMHTLDQRKDAVGALVDEFKPQPTVALLTELQALKLQDDQLKTEIQRLSERIEALVQVVADRWLEEGIQGMDVEGVGSFALQHRLYVSAGDKDQYKQWLRDNGMGGLIQETVAPKTTEALVRERLEDGLPCDEMGLNIHYKTVVR